MMSRKQVQRLCSSPTQQHSVTWAHANLDAQAEAKGEAGW